jgi:hypothetical protein
MVAGTDAFGHARGDEVGGQHRAEHGGNASPVANGDNPLTRRKYRLNTKNSP